MLRTTVIPRLGSCGLARKNTPLDIPESWRRVGEEERLILAATMPLAHLYAASCAEVDPARTLEIAHRNKVVPRTWRYLAARLNPSCQHRWSEFQRLAEHIQRAAARRHLRTIELVIAMEAEGIPTLALKGTVLSERLYGSAALRQSNDIDLMVSPECLPRALASLERRGYRITRPAVVPDRQGLKWLIESYTDYNVQLMNPSQEVSIELHWRLTPNRRFPLESNKRLWQRLEMRNTSNREMRAFNDSDLLLYLAVHGVKDHWRRLSWLADFAWLAARSPVAVRQALERANESGLATIWAAASLMGGRWYGLELARPANSRAKYLSDHACLFEEDPLIVPGGRRRYQLMTYDSWTASMAGTARAYLAPSSRFARSSHDFSPARQRIRRAGRFLRRVIGRDKRPCTR